MNALKQRCAELEIENKYLRKQHRLLQTQNLELTRYLTMEIKSVRKPHRCTPPNMYSIYTKPIKRAKKFHVSMNNDKHLPILPPVNNK